MNQYDPNNPLIEIKTLLATNEQLIRGIVDELKDVTCDVRNSKSAMHDIKSDVMVIESRLDRLDRDAEKIEKERKAMAMMIVTSLVAACLAVITPLVIRPGATYQQPSISTGQSR
jgi:chromosome condensin MukBEF ATPase and DNA-binding subunit MukB